MKQFFIACISIIAFACNTTAQKNTTDANSFEKEINGNTVQLLDVRTATEFKTGHLQNALQADWTNNTQFKERTQHLDKTKPVYV
jgi:rhodanese-related sulfurtransferase